MIRPRFGGMGFPVLAGNYKNLFFAFSANSAFIKNSKFYFPYLSNTPSTDIFILLPPAGYPEHFVAGQAFFLDEKVTKKSRPLEICLNSLRNSGKIPFFCEISSPALFRQISKWPL